MLDAIAAGGTKFVEPSGTGDACLMDEALVETGATASFPTQVDDR